MQEKRHHKRSPINLNLEISEVFKQDNNVIKDLDADINVINISKLGIAFTTSTWLPDGYYFNATIVLGDSDQKILTVVKILNRTQVDENLYRYGCEFVGLAGIFDSLFDEYENTVDAE